jgi:FkbM family methyltransferase
MNHVSYSQNLEDIVLYKALYDVENGRYVDVGAGHPEEMSVTKLFYNLGWSGVNIEPNSAYFTVLEEQRPRDLNLRVLVSDKSETLGYFSASSRELSTANQNLYNHYKASGVPGVTESMQTQRLDQILKQANLKEEIHFLKIDVEGMELNVLRSMDFAQFQPWIVVIESIDPITKSENSATCLSHMISNGYVLAYEDGLNQFFLSNLKNELINRFRFPPNIQDNFIRKSEVNLYALLNSEKNKVEELNLKNRVLEIQIDAQKELLEMQKESNTKLKDQIDSYGKTEKRSEASNSTHSSEGDLENEMTILKEYVRNLELENQAIKNSTIWKYTKGLRVILVNLRELWNLSHRLISVISREDLLKVSKKYIGRRFPGFKRVLKETDSPMARIFRSILKIERKFVSEDGHLDSIFVMGQKVITQQEWNELIKNHVSVDYSTADLDSLIQSKIIERQDSSTMIYSAAVIISLYKSEEYLLALLINLLEQTAFNNCEICILSVEPSVREVELLSRFNASFSNVKLRYSMERIGIYDAWNRMIRASTAPYITNMNADDLRSKNSIQLQIDYLNRNQWVDVVYQDFYYARQHGVRWDVLSKINARSNLPIVSLYSLVARGINPPHNAPMWRRSVHDSVGYFVETLKSAGDIEFWIRCKLQGIVFLKMREIHVSYFLNPKGMSTSVDTPGRSESTDIILKSIEVFNDAVGIESSEINLLDPFFRVQTQVLLRKRLRYELLTIGNLDEY